MASKYIQVSDCIAELIRNETYPVDSKLPTEAALADCYHISRQTVRQALSVLVKRGLIQKKQGSGNWVISTGLNENSRRVAILISDTSDYIYPAILQDIQTVLDQNNCSVQVFLTHNKVGLEREILQHILNDPPDGLLVEGVKTALPNPNLFFYQQLKKKIPIVFFLGGYTELHDTVTVMDDNIAGSYLLTRYLISKGHTRIGGIFNSDDMQGRQRYQGYVAALNDADLPVPDDKLLWFSSEDRYSMLDCCDLGILERFAKSKLHGCTALVVYNDEICYCLLSILQKAGYELPGTMSVVSFDNSYYCNLSSVPITSLSHEGEQIGTVAADQLSRLIRGKEAKSVLIPWKLIERKSS